ncbi:DUF5659 domain-containing protein [Bacillus sp. 2205SS5-2]|uniref:DUF5659 domain-containing protein n=1 Tax=Bacillus sp. 2205SS5-2 TaxID=3109031 RepID=UPI003007A06A
MKDFFFCYDKNLSTYLNEQGIKCVTVAKDIKKGRIFSLYIINSNFQSALSQYKKSKLNQGEKANAGKRIT